MTRLTLGARYGNLDICKYLLETQLADVFQTDNRWKLSVLHHAVSSRETSADLVNFLVLKGAAVRDNYNGINITLFRNKSHK